MQSSFFEYCGSEVKRDDASALVVRRTRPSFALVLIVVGPLLVIGSMALVRLRLSAGPTLLFATALLAITAYCIESYRGGRPRTWTFDKKRREVRIDKTLTYPFERLIRVEFNQERVQRGRARYTRFVLTLCWMAGPERALASRLGLNVDALAQEIAAYVGVPLIYTADGIEMQAFEARLGSGGPT